MRLTKNKMIRKFCDIIKLYPADAENRIWLRPFFYAENYISWQLANKRLRGNVDDIKNYKDIHKGERCFILGNGPSLNKTNLKLLKNEITIVTNRFYRGMAKFGLKPTYYLASNRAVIKDSFGKGLEKIDMPIFLGQPATEVYSFKLQNGSKPFKTKVIPFRYRLEPVWKGAEIRKNIEKGTADGGTVVMDAVQIAYYMGFKKVYLLGCDCNAVKGVKVKHFYEGYVPGCSGQGSSIEGWFKAYEMCKKAFEEDGREIINATVGGELELFRRQNLEEIVKEKIKVG